MAFNLVFLRAHNVLIQQREANPQTPPLRVKMYKLLIHLKMVAFNYLNLVEDGPSLVIDCNDKHLQAKTHRHVSI